MGPGKVGSDVGLISGAARHWFLSDVPGIYRPRHPERTVLYRVLFHNFDRFLTVYEARFKREYGYVRPVVSYPFLKSSNTV